jgi:hypothetical protein
MSTQRSFESRRDIGDISGGAAGGIIFAATMLVVRGSWRVGGTSVTSPRRSAT